MHPAIAATGRAVSSVGKIATRGASVSVSTSTGISQDNIIFGMTLLAFIVYITVKGELPVYLGFFTPQAQLGPAVDTVATGSTTGSATPSAIPGVPGVNTSNPFAGLGPLVGNGSIVGLPTQLGGLLGKLKGLFGGSQ